MSHPNHPQRRPPQRRQQPPRQRRQQPRRQGLSTKAKAWLSVIGFVVIVGSCQNAFNRDDQPRSAAASAPPATSSPYVPPGRSTAVPAAEAAPAPVGEVVTVTKVIDGDTFETSDGRTIRVLGIDSCEMKTYGGGLAKSDAENKLTNPYNQPITLTAEPGVDVDRFGRQLRYVGINGGKYDFGEEMVKNDHTGVYGGENDASDQYLQRLYASDTLYSSNPPSGRECADPYPPAPSSGGSVDADDDDDHNSRDGSIIPACKRKWWC